MITRREVVTAGVLGSLSSSAMAEARQSPGATPGEEAVRGVLVDIKEELAGIKQVLDDSLRKSSLEVGVIGTVRAAYQKYLAANGKFPEFLEIGPDVFFTVWDWHVKHQQPINIIRLAENRMAIQFMFTQLVLRWEAVPGFIGLPYDR